MRRNRNVKIVATLGPASDDYDMIRALHEAGADVFRLNMSHGSHDEIAVKHKIIRQVEEDLGSTIGRGQRRPRVPAAPRDFRGAETRCLAAGQRWQDPPEGRGLRR